MFVGIAADPVTETDGSDVSANGVEAVAIDEAVGGWKTKHAGFRISFLWTGGDAADFEDGDGGGKGEKGVDAFGMLVESSRYGERSFEMVAE